MGPRTDQNSIGFFVLKTISRILTILVKNTFTLIIIEEQETKNKHLKENIMAKGKDSKKNVKKVAAKTSKEKKAEKRLKKSK